MAERSDPPPDRGTVLAEERTDMALMRTRLAAERTLDAWVRTALSMVSFGFTIYKFLEQAGERGGVVPTHPHAPRNLGLALVTLGTLSLIAAIFQHCSFLKELGLHPFRRPVSLAAVVACLVAMLGVLTFMSLAANIGPF